LTIYDWKQWGAPGRWYVAEWNWRGMTNEIISYFEACQREHGSLQKGMNYRRGTDYSIILMSLRPNAPYRDRVEDDGVTLIYEGHDVPRTHERVDAKSVNQPEFMDSGRLTENGKFHKAAQDFKKGLRPSERVRVYEKIKAGIWSYNGVFELIDSWQEYDGQREVFMFKLRALNDDTSGEISQESPGEHRRIIPTAIKMEVWKRDGGKCAICGTTKDLHFDHIIPYSKGGCSTTADNIQLLCARHNLEKHDKIE
jgi:hypothetical protein